MSLIIKNRAIEVMAPFATSGSTVSFYVYDEAHNLQTSGSASEITGTGNYYCSFTPDAVGDWRVVLYSSTEKHIFHYLVYDYVDTYSTTNISSTTETTLFTLSKTGVYSLSVYVDLNLFVTNSEGGVVTLRLKNRIDGTNYRTIAETYFTVGSSSEHPNFEVDAIHDFTMVTLQCSSAPGATRAIPYRYIVLDKGS